MNWYTRLKQAMPLPEAVDYPTDPDAAGGAYRRMNSLLEEPNAKNVENWYPGLKYLGHGEGGLAFLHNTPHSVVKLTSDRDEFLLARKLMRYPVNCVVNVYNVKEAQPSTYKGVGMQRGVWAIELEKLIPLADSEAQMINDIYDCMDASYSRSIEEIYVALGEPKDINGTIEKYMNLIHCLKSNRLRPDDAHGRNIGKRADGSFVLLDLGYAATPEFLS